MKEIVEALKKRISENKNSMLVTVVAGRGSIPRKAGAYMVVGEDGRVTGTIGGGNLEYQATHRTTIIEYIICYLRTITFF